MPPSLRLHLRLRVLRLPPLRLPQRLRSLTPSPQCTMGALDTRPPPPRAVVAWTMLVRWLVGR